MNAVSPPACCRRILSIDDSLDRFFDEVVFYLTKTLFLINRHLSVIRCVETNYSQLVMIYHPVYRPVITRLSPNLSSDL